MVYFNNETMQSFLIWSILKSGNCDKRSSTLNFLLFKADREQYKKDKEEDTRANFNNVKHTDISPWKENWEQYLGTQ